MGGGLRLGALVAREGLVQPPYRMPEGDHRQTYICSSPPILHYISVDTPLLGGVNGFVPKPSS
jgi:hypothetical protein